MAAPIGPGDWVECVQNRHPTTLPPRGLIVGRCYMVSAAGVTPAHDVQPGVPWVRLVGVPDPAPKWGYRAAWFRPVYRPKADLIESLKAPPQTAPKRETEAA